MRALLEEEESVNHRWDTSGKRLRRRRVRVDKRTCPECHGDGVVHIEEQYIAAFCSHCKGKGYIGEEVVGETISYSSSGAGRGVPQPEPRLDVASLVQEAREASEENLKVLARQIELDGKNVQVVASTLECVINRELRLCNALEEKEREVERLREGCEIWKQQSNINFQGLCGRDRQIANQELEIQRLREALQGLYEAAHTTWMNDDIEMAVEEAHEALAASEAEREERRGGTV